MPPGDVGATGFPSGAAFSEIAYMFLFRLRDLIDVRPSNLARNPGMAQHD
jgi:hypothetical protein